MQKTLLFSIFFLLAQISEAQSVVESPNFIFILADDQGWNGTSVKMIEDNEFSKSDFYETPNIERIAKKGLIFSNAYASAPVCAPSRYSIQFGQTPARLKMIRVGMNTEHINHEGKISIPKELKKINPSINGEIIFPKNIPNLNHNIFNGVRKFELINPRTRNVKESNKDHNLKSPL